MFLYFGILRLNEVRKNLAANLERSPLMRSYGYASAGDRPILFARFPLNFVPFMQYTGKQPEELDQHHG